MLNLRPQIRSNNVRRQERRAYVHPTVLIYFSPIECRAGGPFLTNNFGSRPQPSLVDGQHAALARDYILGFVKRESTQCAQRAQGLPPVVAVDGVGRIFHHGQTVPVGHGQNGSHLAGNARIVHRYDSARAGRYQVFEGAGVEIRIERRAVGKYDVRPAQYECISRTHERERRHNDLIARLDGEQQGCHFQRIGAGGSKQHFLKTPLLLEIPVHSLRKHSIAADFTGTHRLLDVTGLVAREIRLVEGNRNVHGRTKLRAGRWAVHAHHSHRW